MNSTYDTDVLIVGAGPTGLTLAASLVSTGYRHHDVDAQPRPPTPHGRPR